MIADWPIVTWFLDSLKKAFPPARTGRIVEDPDILGYYWVWDDEVVIDWAEEGYDHTVWDDTIDDIEWKMGLGTYDCDKCLILVFGDEDNG